MSEIDKDINVPNKNDAISRQEALDALGERPMVWGESDYELGARNQYDMDRLAIETVPSAQPGWIPTSVRLPEDNEEVLFCDNKGERWLGWHYGFWKTERLDFDEDEVVAWMPLPIPYREGEPNE